MSLTLEIDFIIKILKKLFIDYSYNKNYMGQKIGGICSGGSAQSLV